MRLARKLHLYFGVFFAPSIIFFAFSGFFQAFGWHEEHDGKPPMAWVATISEIHKDQRLPASRRAATQPTPASSAPATSQGAALPATAGSTSAPGQVAAPAKAAVEAAPAAANLQRPAPRKKSFPLQVFMGFMAVGLIGSSLVGIWMGFQLRPAAFIWTLLLAGTIIPFAALYIGTRP